MKDKGDKPKRDYSKDDRAGQMFGAALVDDRWAERIAADLRKMNADKSGRPFEFPDSAVEWGMNLRTSGRFSYRKALGAVNHLLGKHGCGEMSLAQFFDRSVSFAEKTVHTCDVTDSRVMAHGSGGVAATGEPITVAVDSTGIPVNKYGSWLTHRWNAAKVTGWIKLHVAVNVDTNEILSYVVTDESCGDVSCTERLIDTAMNDGHRIAKIVLDAAYDKKELWNRYRAEGIEFYANLRTSLLGRHSGGEVRSRGCPFRAAQIRVVREKGRDEWKRMIDYGRRWKVECTFSDLKRMFGELIRSRRRRNIASEMFWMVGSHNLYKKMRRSVVGSVP